MNAKRHDRKPRPSAKMSDAEIRKRNSTALGDMLIDPALTNGSVITAYTAPGFAHWREIGTTDAMNALDATIQAVQKGDLGRLEEILVTQVFATQAMFADFATRGRAQRSRDAAGQLITLALKAQGASRATVQALVELKYPKTTVFTRQANVNNGGQQQVNNGVADTRSPRSPARTREDGVNPPDELLAEEHRHGSTTLDTRTTRPAASGHSGLAAVERINRPEECCGKSDIRPQCGSGQPAPKAPR